MDNFSWNSASDIMKIAVRQVDPVAVYLANNNQDVVIRQRHPLGDDDSVVVVPVAYVAGLIAALQVHQAARKK